MRKDRFSGLVAAIYLRRQSFIDRSKSHDSDTRTPKLRMLEREKTMEKNIGGENNKLQELRRWDFYGWANR